MTAGCRAGGRRTEELLTEVRSLGPDVDEAAPELGPADRVRRPLPALSGGSAGGPVDTGLA